MYLHALFYVEMGSVGGNALQVTGKVMHYFLIYKKISELLFSHLLTDKSRVPMLREIRSRGVVCVNMLL